MARRKSRKPTFSPINKLPNDIFIKILLKLCTKRIVICKSVCKDWKKVISDPEFANVQLVHGKPHPLVRILSNNYASRTLYLVETEDAHCFSLKDPHNFPTKIKLRSKLKIPVFNAPLAMLIQNQVTENKAILLDPEHHNYHIMNSCNGMLCMCDPIYNNPAIICNPVTGEFVKLPQTCIEERFFPYAGFGYIPKDNKYKVIRASFDSIHEYKETEIYKLSSSSWSTKVAGVVKANFEIVPPIYANGVLYWFPKYPDQVYKLYKDFYIVCFDLDKEEFCSLTMPPLRDWHIEMGLSTMSMGTLRGYICVLQVPPFIGGSTEVWGLKNDGVNKYWDKMFDIEVNFFPIWECYALQPISEFRDGALLMFEGTHDRLIYCNPENKEQFLFLNLRGPQSDFQVIAHVPTFISLKDIMMGSNREVLNVNSR